MGKEPRVTSFAPQFLVDDLDPDGHIICFWGRPASDGIAGSTG
jgi:hypothetical protein